MFFPSKAAGYRALLLKISVAALLVLLNIFAYLYFSTSAKSDLPAKRGPINYEEEVKKIDDALTNFGLANGTELFIGNYSEYDAETVHELEHFLGAELYKRGGLEGASFCPNSPLAGCYHGFFIEASINEGGLFVNKMENTCKNQKGFMRINGCIHGIGHGLLSLSPDRDLIKALSECDELNYSIPFGAEMCYTGVFMEYNTQSIHGIVARGINPRAFDPREPYLPCESVPDKYRSACYLQLPQWWYEWMNNDFENMGTLCINISEEIHRENCSRSIGMVSTLTAKYEPVKIIGSCEQIPDEKYGYFCLEESAKLLIAKGEAKSLSICRIAGENKRRCIENIKSFLCEMVLVCGIKDEYSAINLP